MREIEYSTAIRHNVVADSIKEAIEIAKEREDESPRDRTYTGLVVTDKAQLEDDTVYRVRAILDYHLIGADVSEE